jgi:hypothetical protein
MKRGTYKKTVKSCAHCGAEFEGTARAKYCSRSHSVLATRTRLGQPSLWELVKQLKEENARLLTQINEVENRKSVRVAAPVRVVQPVVSVPAVKKIETPVAMSEPKKKFNFGSGRSLTLDEYMAEQQQLGNIS